MNNAKEGSIRKMAKRIIGPLQDYWTNWDEERRTDVLAMGPILKRAASVHPMLGNGRQLQELLWRFHKDYPGRDWRRAFRELKYFG